MELQITNVNLQNLEMFINACEAKGASHVLEINGDDFTVKASPQDKKYVKFTQASFKDIGEIDTKGNHVLIPFSDLSKLLASISIFIKRKNTENVKISLLTEPYVNAKGVAVENTVFANRVRIIHKNQKTTVQVAEMQFVSYMPDVFWEAFSNTKGYLAKFDLTAEDIDHIQDSTKLETTEKSKGINTCKLNLSKDSKPTFLSSREKEESRWTISLTGNCLFGESFDEPVSVAIPIEALKKAKAPLYEVYLVKLDNGMRNMVYVANEKNIVLHAV